MINLPDELILQITSQHQTGRDYKAFMQVNHQWYNCVYSRDKIHSYMNVLSTFIKYNQLHDASQQLHDASQQLHMDKFIYQYAIHLSLDMLIYGIEHNIISVNNACANPRIDSAFIHKYVIGDSYLWSVVSTYVNLTDDLFYEFRQYWTLFYVVQNKSISMSIICEIWNDIKDTTGIFLECIAKKTSLTSKFVIDNLSHFNKCDKILMRLLQNPSMCILIESADLNLDQTLYSYVSKNKGLTPAFIRKYADKLNWIYLSANRALTLPLIREFEDRVNMETVYYNPNINMDYIRENNLEWTGQFMEENPNLSPEFIIQHMNDMDEDKIIKNRAFTLELMEKYLCDFKNVNIFINPNMTIEFLQEHKGVIANWG